MIIGANAGGQFAQAMAVDRNCSFEDEFLAGTPRAKTGPGKILVQPHKVPFCSAIRQDKQYQPKGTSPIRPTSRLSLGLGLGQVHHAAAVFPDAALFHQVNALETLEDVALGCNGAGRTKAAVLGHKGYLWLKGSG